MYYLDHIRAALTILLLFHHSAISYGASGDWYYVEPVASGITKALLSLVTGVDQAFFLVTLALLLRSVPLPFLLKWVLVAGAGFATGFALSILHLKFRKRILSRLL